MQPYSITKYFVGLVVITMWTGLPSFCLAQSYLVVDTGQNQCYGINNAVACPGAGEEYYGQDAQFNGNQPDFTLGADGLTVYDNVTGLTWTKSPDLNRDGVIDYNDKLTYDQALTYADSLNAENFGGYGDWRLPDIKTLYSLMNFQGTDPGGNSGSIPIPYIDTAYFDFGYGDESAGEREIDAQFWSTNRYVAAVMDGQQAAFGLNMADGRIKGYGIGGLGGRGGQEKAEYVYFVRGAEDYGVNDFIDNGDGTVTDRATGLMWSQGDSGTGLTWVDALAWVQRMNDENYLGYSDWRLPNAKELHTIVDYSRAPEATGSAAIDPVFDITRIANEAGQIDYPWFWAGTTHASTMGGGDGVYICFGRAMGYMNGKWMDVHGAGAQRSDQKNGDFSRYTYVPDGYYFGPAPQGDASRQYNYVRLVRGGAY